MLSNVIYIIKLLVHTKNGFQLMPCFISFKDGAGAVLLILSSYVCSSLNESCNVSSTFKHYMGHIQLSIIAANILGKCQF